MLIELNVRTRAFCLPQLVYKTQGPTCHMVSVVCQISATFAQFSNFSSFGFLYFESMLGWQNSSGAILKSLLNLGSPE